jgi:uncharacterized protein (DUF779 family)
MFVVDEAPERVTTTPAASAQLSALAARHGDLMVLLSDGRARVLPAGQSAPSGAVQLGRLDDAVTVAADGTRTDWWRNRAVIDLTDSAVGTGFTFDLEALNEAELYAALASGPLPRY